MSLTSNRSKRRALSLSNIQISLIYTIFFVVLANWPFWNHFIEASKASGINPYPFQISFLLCICILTFLTFHLVIWKRTFKFLATIILIASSFCLYFMSTFGVFIDQAMIQNAVETHKAETLDLLNVKLATYILFFGIIPLVFAYKLEIVEKSIISELKKRFRTVVLSAIALIVLIVPFSKDYIALSRNHRELRYLYNPSNYVYSTIILGYKSFKDNHKKLIHVGDDAKQADIDKSPARKRVFVLVIGETARAANFSLLGYKRDTNPYLSKEDIITYSKAYSCGTSTAISLPCIFNHLGREKGGDTSKAKRYENLLDVLQGAGIKTIWRENNSGCKGICARSEVDPVPTNGPESLCTGGQCQDEVLLNNLKERIQDAKQDTLIILHTQGSHGPAYYKRYPKEFNKYTPTCDTANIEECTQEAIINSYDNTILYSDFFLYKLIEILKEASQTHDTGMLYASDHGESLGENNIYLHGSPYFLAPDNQIHIPFIIWLSDQFQERANITKSCLEKNKDKEISHDYIYQSILSAFKVETSIYNPELDLFSSNHCGIDP